MTNEPLHFYEPLKITEEEWYKYDRDNYIKKHAHLIFAAQIATGLGHTANYAVLETGALFDAIRAEVKK